MGAKVIRRQAPGCMAVILMSNKWKNGRVLLIVINRVIINFIY